MVKFFFNLQLAIIIGICVLVPVMGKAAVSPGPTPDGGSSGITNAYTLNNPIKVDSIQELLGIILRLAIIIATPIVVLFIILAGFKYVTARGNASQVEEATKALTYAVIGGVLIIGAVAISKIIEGLVKSF